MTLRLTDEEHQALRERAALDGVSMQKVARLALREFLALDAPQDRIGDIPGSVILRHGEALRRLASEP